MQDSCTSRAARRAAASSARRCSGVIVDLLALGFRAELVDATQHGEMTALAGLLALRGHPCLALAVFLRQCREALLPEAQQPDPVRHPRRLSVIRAEVLHAGG